MEIASFKFEAALGTDRDDGTEFVDGIVEVIDLGGVPRPVVTAAEYTRQLLVEVLGAEHGPQGGREVASAHCPCRMTYRMVSNRLCNVSMWCSPRTAEFVRGADTAYFSEPQVFEDGDRGMTRVSKHVDVGALGVGSVSPRQLKGAFGAVRPHEIDG
jgi:hypothetical protein